MSHRLVGECRGSVACVHPCQSIHPSGTLIFPYRKDDGVTHTSITKCMCVHFEHYSAFNDPSFRNAHQPFSVPVKYTPRLPHIPQCTDVDNAGTEPYTVKRPADRPLPVRLLPCRYHPYKISHLVPKVKDGARRWSIVVRPCGQPPQHSPNWPIRAGLSFRSHPVSRVKCPLYRKGPWC